MDSLFHFEGSSILLLCLTEGFYAEMWAQVKLVSTTRSSGGQNEMGRLLGGKTFDYGTKSRNGNIDFQTLRKNGGDL